MALIEFALVLNVPWIAALVEQTSSRIAQRNDRPLEPPGEVHFDEVATVGNSHPTTRGVRDRREADDGMRIEALDPHALLGEPETRRAGQCLWFADDPNTASDHRCDVAQARIADRGSPYVANDGKAACLAHPDRLGSTTHEPSTEGQVVVGDDVLACERSRRRASVTAGNLLAAGIGSRCHRRQNGRGARYRGRRTCSCSDGAHRFLAGFYALHLVEAPSRASWRPIRRA